MLTFQEIKELIGLINQSSINDFVYKNNGVKITLHKSNSSNESQDIQQAISTVQVTQADNLKTIKEIPTEEIHEQVQEKVLDVNESNVVEITSPMVGTFYRKPSPESDFFVNIGSKVVEDSVVCIVEAMKLFNEIEAETIGEIVEVLVEDGELVEYGQPLFKVKTK